MIKVFLEADRFILGGGGLLQETTSSWNHFYYLSLIIMAKLFGCRTETLALGADPMKSRFNRLFTRFAFNLAVDHCSVRDVDSKKALQAAGVAQEIVISKDPVFELQPALSMGGAEGIALAVSPSKSRPDWSQEIADFCDEVHARLRVPIDLIVFFPAEDERLARDIARRAWQVRQIRIGKNPIDLLSWMPQYQMVVATRFHALVLAARNKTPFFGWGAQHKVATLCRERGMTYINTEENWNMDQEVERIA